jgi:hypothetical protein
MDIDKGTETLNKADGFLKTLKTLLRDHWGILMLIGLGLFVYWAVNLPDEELEPTKIETVVVEKKVTEKSKYTITKQTYMVDDYGYRKGDTVLIDYYSDGFVDKYYADNEDYKNY